MYEISNLDKKPIVQLMFRLAGDPSKNSLKKISINSNQKISQIKELVKKAYGINPLIVIQLLYNGFFLHDNFLVGESNILQFKDEIIIMAVMTGA